MEDLLMVQDKIDILIIFISSLIVLLFTLIFNEVVLGLVFALIFYPVLRRIAKQLYKKT